MQKERRKSGEMGMYGGAIYYLCAGAALGICSQLLVAWDQTVGASHWWEIVTAFATVAAVVVALFISGAEGRRLELKELLKAQLVALILRPKLTAFVAEVTIIRDLLRNVSINSAPVHMRSGCVQRLAQFENLLTRADAEALAGGPGRCSETLANVIAYREVLSLALQVPNPSAYDDAMHVRIAERLLNDADRLMKICIGSVAWR